MKLLIIASLFSFLTGAFARPVMPGEFNNTEFEELVLGTFGDYDPDSGAGMEFVFPRKLFEVIDFEGDKFVSTDVGIYKVTRGFFGQEKGTPFLGSCSSSISCKKIIRFQLKPHSKYIAVMTYANKEAWELNLYTGAYNLINLEQ